ncbi:MAG: 3'-5' exoribonuclease [Pseudomonadales bacterium]|nr:3'-5' exoribonuclease [Pseudomonadales bacterium]
MNFIAIDVETANADMASICQIGIAVFSENELIDEWVTLINPEDYFDPINIDIHGINELDVENSPTFPEISDTLLGFLKDTIVVCHTHFDRVSISRTFWKHGIEMIEVSWLDSAKVARRTWPEFSKKGYGLKNVAKHIGYDFKHHDALEDAKASGYILLEAMRVSSLSITDWKIRATKPINLGSSSSGSDVKRDGNPQGLLYGEVIVFTGALLIPRKEAADFAANIGCKVAPSVTKKTTLLVVGDQDLSKLSGKDKSSKHIKAEELISKGQSIRILKESDFQELVKNTE